MNQLESHKLEKKAQIEMTSYGRGTLRSNSRVEQDTPKFSLHRCCHFSGLLQTKL